MFCPAEAGRVPARRRVRPYWLHGSRGPGPASRKSPLAARTRSRPPFQSAVCVLAAQGSEASAPSGITSRYWIYDIVAEPY